MAQFSGTGTCAASPCCNACSCHSPGEGIAVFGGGAFEQKPKGQPHRRRANLGRSTSQVLEVLEVLRVWKKHNSPFWNFCVMYYVCFAIFVFLSLQISMRFMIKLVIRWKTNTFAFEHRLLLKHDQTLKTKNNP